MEHQLDGLNHHVISESFYSEHPKIRGPVKVFSKLHYLMAEYHILTGATNWKRVVPAPQRAGIEKWLGTHYPVPVVA